MNEDIDIRLFDIDSSNIIEMKTRISINQNGFLLCRQGEMVIEMEEHLYNIKGGDLYVFPAFTTTKVRSVSHDMRGIMGMADFDFVLNSIDRFADTPYTVYIRFHPHLPLTQAQVARIEETAHIIQRRITVESPLRQHIISTLALSLCYEIVDAFLAHRMMEPSVQTRKDKVFQNFITHLYQHACTDRDVTYYASLQYLTPRYFATIITAKSGMTPSRWIALFVVNEAKRLLADPKMSIKEIAERLHFANQSLFGRYFKKHVGVYPSIYRRG